MAWGEIYPNLKMAGGQIYPNWKMTWGHITFTRGHLYPIKYFVELYSLGFFFGHSQTQNEKIQKNKF